MINKRQTYRVPCHIETTLFKQKLNVPCIVKDISFEGCCIHLAPNSPFRTNQTLHINLFPHHKEQGILHGRIIHSVCDSQILHLHVKFTIRSVAERKFIKTQVAQLERLHIHVSTFSNTTSLHTPATISNPFTHSQELPHTLSIQKLTTPEKERRKIYRIPCQFRTSLTYNHSIYPAIIRNVSLYGCCIYLISKQDFKKDSLVTFTLGATPADTMSVQGEILQVSSHHQGISLHLKFAFTHPNEAQTAKSCITAIQTQYIKNKCQSAKNA